jgi:hypothetical protein
MLFTAARAHNVSIKGGDMMKHSTTTMRRLTVLTTIVLLLAISTTLATSSSGYDLSWFTVDGGGGTVSGGSYTLSGTAGQPDVGPALSSSGYTLIGGFWGGAVARSWPLYLPLVVKGR